MEQCKCSTQIRGLTVRKRDGVDYSAMSPWMYITASKMAIMRRATAREKRPCSKRFSRAHSCYTRKHHLHQSEGRARLEKPRIGYVPQNMVFDRSTPMTAADMLCARSLGVPDLAGA